MSPRPPGTLTGVGVGPGDPGLLTVAGRAAIAAAAAVFAPRAADRTGSMAAAVADRPVVEIPSPMRAGAGAAAGERYAQAILPTLRAGGDAVFLTEGDPTLYSTWGHLAAAVRRRCPAVPLVTVPGVSAVTAAAAAAGLTLATGDETVAVVPGSYVDADQVRLLLAQFTTVVILKAARALPWLRPLLAAEGRLEEAVYVRRAGTPAEEVAWGLRDLQAPDDYFACVIVRAGGRLR